VKYITLMPPSRGVLEESILLVPMNHSAKAVDHKDRDNGPIGGNPAYHVETILKVDPKHKEKGKNDGGHGDSGGIAKLVLHDFME